MFLSLNARCCMALIAATALWPADLSAQENDAGFWSLRMENDMLGDSNGYDGHYTHGTLISYLTAHRPLWLRKLAGVLPCVPCRNPEAVKYEFGQSIYTPSDTSLSMLAFWDRPYAGWLFMGASLINTTPQRNGVRTDVISLKLGVIGPASQAQRIQTFIHKKRNLRMPRGWQNQLSNEPGFILGYKRSWHRGAERQWGFGFDSTPYVVGALGNVHTYLGGGVTLRSGFNLGAEQTLQRRSIIGLHAFVRIEGRAVARNIFLDGNTWVASHSVEKRPIVGEIQYGLSYTAANLEIRLSRTVRSREFDGQFEPDHFGAVTFTYRP